MKRQGLIQRPTVLRLARYGVLVCMSLLAFLACVPAHAAEVSPDQPIKNASLRVGLASTAFLGVNRNDAEASFKLLIASAAKRKRYLVDLKMEYFDSVPSFTAVITNNLLHLASIDVWDYLDMQIESYMEPAYIISRQGRPGETYQLLTRQGSGINALRELHRKPILLYRANNAKAAPIWLESILSEEGLGSSQRFFSKVDVVDKPTLAALPVFFGKVDACIISSGSFEVMKELNPELGNKLTALRVSEELVENIIFVSRNNWISNETRKDLMKTVEDLAADAAGLQMLRMFKSDGILPFRPELLNSMRKLKATIHGGQPRGPQ